MQKVERQKHKDRKRRRLTGVILCTLLLAICITAGLLLRQKAEKTVSASIVKHEAQTGDIFLRDEKELNSLTLFQQGKESWTVARDEEGSLRLKQEETGELSSWTVDENIAELLKKAAANLTFDDVFAEKRSEWEAAEEAFGLKEPQVTAVFRFTDDTEVTVHIGKSADPENNRYYYMSVDGDERLYAVSAGIMDDLMTEKTLLHPVPRLEIQSALLDRISVKNADGSLRKEWSLQGDVKDRDAAENWLLTAPFTYPADYDSISNLKENAGNLRLGVFVDEANQETLKLYGFEEPTAILEFHTAAGSTGTVGMSGIFDVSDWEEHLYTLTIGGMKSEMSSYVLYEDNIYSISDFTMSAFLKVEPSTTVARYVVTIPVTSLERAVVEKQGEEPVTYVLERVTEAGDEEAAPKEIYRCLKNGQEISYDTFEAAWERLLTVTVSGKLSQDYEPVNVHTKYTFSTVSGRTHTLELSELDQMHDMITLDGCSRFYLIKGGMTDLP